MSERDKDYSKAAQQLRETAQGLEFEFPDLAKELRDKALELDPPKYPIGTVVEVDAYVVASKGGETFLAYAVNGEFYKKRNFNGSFSDRVRIYSTYKLTPYYPVGGKK